jgi:hypothetical protein
MSNPASVRRSRIPIRSSRESGIPLAFAFTQGPVSLSRAQATRRATSVDTTPKKNAVSAEMSASRKCNLRDRASAAATCPYGHYLTFLTPEAWQLHALVRQHCARSACPSRRTRIPAPTRRSPSSQPIDRESQQRSWLPEWSPEQSMSLKAESQNSSD